MIKLNGLVIVNDDEIYFEDFTIETEEELDLPFDYLTDEEEDYYGYDCDDCEDCDCYDDENNYYDEDEIEFDLDNDERFDDYTDDYKRFLSKYVRKVYDTDFCPHCLADVLNEFFEDDFN